MEMRLWDHCVEEALSKLESLKLIRSLRPIHLPSDERRRPIEMEQEFGLNSDEFEVFDGLQEWDRASVEVEMAESTFQRWVRDVPRDDADCGNQEVGNEAGACSHQKFRKLLLFSGNDYLGLSTHPTISKAAAKAALAHGMGPKGSALICGYTNYHRLLESCLADLKSKEDCLLCPTGFAANMAFMTTLGSVGSLLAAGGKPLKDDRVAIFSDALNHASIIDGIRLAERQGSVVAFVYRHSDMSHLNALLLRCPMKKKVVVTDSMDGDFAPMGELSKLRKRHGFLLVIDDAHGTFVCGKNGGGVAEEFNCESDVDICVGTLSKAAGCHGGFIACSSTFDYNLPAAVIVAQKETWRRRAIWKRVQDFHALTGLPVTSPIISLVVGSEEKALQASWYLLKSGFHVTAIRPPTVPPNSCRLRVTLSAAHTLDDLKKFTAALSECINFRDMSVRSTNGHARL
ncbi:hypothetical protein C3L33_03070, partial [Rhododendron williamsianum]